MRTQHSGWKEKQGKNMILTKRDNESKRVTSQYLRNERMEVRWLEEKNGEDSDNFNRNWIWKSLLKKKDRTELLENQQWKE